MRVELLQWDDGGRRAMLLGVRETNRWASVADALDDPALNPGRRVKLSGREWIIHSRGKLMPDALTLSLRLAPGAEGEAEPPEPPSSIVGLLAQLLEAEVDVLRQGGERSAAVAVGVIAGVFRAVAAKVREPGARR